MTNVFTRKNRHPRTTTLLDFKNFNVNIQAPGRVMSPTRKCIPHPVGLNLQSIPSTQTYLIWHPNFTRKAAQYETMNHHIKHVNFSCNHMGKFDYVKKKTKVPTINFTENTIYRESYKNPSRFPALRPKSPTARFGNPGRKAVTGIVPTLIVPEYLSVKE